MYTVNFAPLNPGSNVSFSISSFLAMKIRTYCLHPCFPSHFLTLFHFLPWCLSPSHVTLQLLLFHTDCSFSCPTSRPLGKECVGLFAVCSLSVEALGRAANRVHSWLCPLHLPRLAGPWTRATCAQLRALVTRASHWSSAPEAQAVDGVFGEPLSSPSSSATQCLLACDP